MATKFEQKIVTRLLDRLEANGLDSAVKYGLAACSGSPAATTAVLSGAPEPLRKMLIAGFLGIQLRKQEKLSTAERLRRRIISDGLINARNTGQAVVYLAGFNDVNDRNQSGATKQELENCQEMRIKVWGSQTVKSKLDCSETELRRWVEDGLLPILYRQNRRLDSGIPSSVRYWSQHFVNQCSNSVAKWREDDLLTKRQKRR